MLDKFEIVSASVELMLQGQLSSDVLLVAFKADGSDAILLKSDLSLNGIKVLQSALTLVDAQTDLRAICRERDRSKLDEVLGNADVASLRISTYKRRCQWRVNSNSLRYLEDEKIRVLIVDDSKTIRTLLERIFNSDKAFEIVGSVEDPLLAMDEIGRTNPDVMTLDIHMPGMTGVELLKKVMASHPVPTVMISSLSMEDGPEVLNAFKFGAVDYVQKPSFDQLSAVAPVLIEKVKIAASVDVRPKSANQLGPKRIDLKLRAAEFDRRKVIYIGSSTGGTEAIRRIFRSMPKSFPPVLITQHIPALFSQAFADSLKREFSISVFEAKDGQEVLANQVLIAPGGTQMEVIVDRSGVLRVRVFDGAPVNRHKPSVDVLFDSAAKHSGKHAVGVILTGMGNDGAKGLKKMRDVGAATIAQDEQSSTVYGMPKVAFEIGAAEKVLDLDQIAEAILEKCKLKAAA